MNAEMTGDDVIEIIQLLTNDGIMVHVDGGWGVDTLLGEQIRPHADLDIAVQHRNVPRLRELLRLQGYGDVPRDDSQDCNFVLKDGSGHEIDVHSYTFDSNGKHVFGIEYPADSLTGTGTIGGREVDCITPEWMVKFHTGHELNMNSYRDVSALCKRFGIELPSEFRRFQEK